MYDTVSFITSISKKITFFRKLSDNRLTSVCRGNNQKIDHIFLSPTATEDDVVQWLSAQHRHRLKKDPEKSSVTAPSKEGEE